ncbi:hypothetical protein AURDEDRAFT_114392 [Auricularia subglabra TFB-10046 SS5]|nr:hypothetical protein AURDEDRAFT_114392 [Auricularia subglabra TFB-10046 SS5]
MTKHRSRAIFRNDFEISSRSRDDNLGSSPRMCDTTVKVPIFGKAFKTDKNWVHDACWCAGREGLVHPPLVQNTPIQMVMERVARRKCDGASRRRSIAASELA